MPRAELLDRADERAVLDGLLSAAGQGQSGALVIHGQAGMGKTALLDYAADSSASLPLLRISGVEAEREFVFAGLHRLLLSLLGHLDELPRGSGMRCARPSACPTSAPPIRSWSASLP